LTAFIAPLRIGRPARYIRDRGIGTYRRRRPMALTPRFEDALVFAARLHGGDMGKGTTIPYVSHVLGVASLALEHGANEDEAIGALLHDTVEDAKGDQGGPRPGLTLQLPWRSR
jgi:(p)ppGpp synthase/HD superfamily hydrolase